MKKYIIIFLMSLSGQVFAQNKHGERMILGYGEDFPPEYSTYIVNFAKNPPFFTPYYETYLGWHQHHDVFCTDNGIPQYITNGCYIFSPLIEEITGIGLVNPGYVSDDWCSTFDGVPDAAYPVGYGWNFLDWPEKDSVLFITNHLIYKAAYKLSLTDSIFYTILNNKGNNGSGSGDKPKKIKMPGIVQDWHTMSCRHANGIDWWILMAGYADKNWYRFLLDKDGLHGPYTQEIGEQKDLVSEAGQSVFSPNGKKYAYINGGSNEVLLFDFNRKTGELSNPLKFTYTIADSLSKRGLSFSPNNQFLYVSAEYFLYQFDLESSDIQSSIVKIAEYEDYTNPPFVKTPVYFCGQQLVDNGKIYIFPNAKDYRFVHVINAPNEKGTACDFVQRGLPLKSYDSWVGPNLPYYQMAPDTTTSTVYVPIDIGISISPNPCKDYLDVMINGPNVQDLVIEVVDNQGRVLIRRRLEHTIQKLKLDVSALVSGVNYLKVTDKDSRVVSRKFVKE